MKVAAAYPSSWVGAVAVVLVGFLASLPGLVAPAIYHDEAITLLLTAGNPVPSWPDEVALAGELRQLAFHGATTPVRLVRDLRLHDVHPPVYFLLVSGWSSLFGHSLEALRTFSVLMMVGAGLAFRSMLRRSGHPAPDLTSLLLVSLSGLVGVGQAARPYGLALLLLCLAAWCAVEHGERPAWRLALGCAFFCSLAFLTSYLAIFPVAAILLAFVLRAWPLSRRQALSVPILATISWVPWAGFVAQQMRSRPGQDAGFAGWPLQLVDLWRANETLVWISPQPIRTLAVSMVLCLVAWAWSRLRRPPDRALSWLLFGWAVTPTLGVVILNLALDKQLSSVRYFIFAAPGIVGLLGYVLRLVPRVSIAVLLTLGFVGVQLTALVRFAARGTSPSNLARVMEGEGLRSTVVVLGAGAGFDGFSPQVLYEVNPRVPVLVLDEEADLSALEDRLDPYSEVWLLAPPAVATQGLEARAFRQLLAGGKLRVIQANEAACRLVRR